MKKNKRILSCVLALALMVGMLPLFASEAKAASFSDITDSETAQNVEVLRMLGVFDGTGEGRFEPEGNLTRAQFCKMAVVMLGQKGAVGQHETYTIFPDVRASHWAAGYVNLAVRGEQKILAGYPDGSFHPDENITFGQTVTILMRMLGYQDKDVGAVWPYGYLNAAAGIGLTEGVKAGANDAITRAEAAKLFFNLLLTDTKSGGNYAGKIGTVVSDVLLLSVNATAPDGTKGALQTTEKTYKVAERRVDDSFVGSCGTLLLDDAGRVLTFIPDSGMTKTTVTAAEFKANGVVDSYGKMHTIYSGTAVYYRGKEVSYSDAYIDLRAGMSVTLHFNAAGDLTYVFVGGSIAEDAVIVARDGSTIGFERLTDAENYTIYKNGVLATPADLRQYDVATYDAATNSIRISNTRLTGYYENVEPNRASPTKVTVLGHEFSVLPCAVESLSAYKIGQMMTLLLTEDHQIAAAVEPKVRGNAVGIVKSVSGSTATVELFCGLSISGDTKSKNAAQYEGQLVKVSSYQKGQISLTRLSSGDVRGDFDVPNRVVGKTPLAENVRIYDKVGKAALVPISITDLDAVKIPAASVVYAEKNYAEKVHILVLDNVTGDAYTYGRYNFTPAEYTEEGDFLSNARISVENGNGVSAEAECGGGYKDGAFGGLAFYTDSGGTTRLAGTAQMKQLEDVDNSAWNGSASVTVKGMTYLVSKDVVCYNKTTKQWVTLAKARAFASTTTLYYDSIGEKIRIVVVEQDK